MTELARDADISQEIIAESRLNQQQCFGVTDAGRHGLPKIQEILLDRASSEAVARSLNFNGLLSVPIPLATVSDTARRIWKAHIVSTLTSRAPSRIDHLIKRPRGQKSTASASIGLPHDGERAEFLTEDSVFIELLSI